MNGTGALRQFVSKAARLSTRAAFWLLAYWSAPTSNVTGRPAGRNPVHVGNRNVVGARRSGSAAPRLRESVESPQMIRCSPMTSISPMRHHDGRSVGKTFPASARSTRADGVRWRRRSAARRGRLSAMPLKPLRTGAAHVVPLRSITVHENAHDFSADSQEEHPRTPRTNAVQAAGTDEVGRRFKGDSRAAM